MQWSPVPLDSLLDVDQIIDFWKPRGLVIHRTPALRPFPDLTQPDVAFPLYPQKGVDPSLVARCVGSGILLGRCRDAAGLPVELAGPAWQGVRLGSGQGTAPARCAVTKLRWLSSAVVGQDSPP